MLEAEVLLARELEKKAADAIIEPSNTKTNQKTLAVVGFCIPQVDTWGNSGRYHTKTGSPL